MRWWGEGLVAKTGGPAEVNGCWQQRLVHFTTEPVSLLEIVAVCWATASGNGGQQPAGHKRRGNRWFGNRKHANGSVVAGGLSWSTGLKLKLNTYSREYVDWI